MLMAPLSVLPEPSGPAPAPHAIHPSVHVSPQGHWHCCPMSILSICLTACSSAASPPGVTPHSPPVCLSICVSHPRVTLRSPPICLFVCPPPVPQCDTVQPCLLVHLSPCLSVSPTLLSQSSTMQPPCLSVPFSPCSLPTPQPSCLSHCPLSLCSSPPCLSVLPLPRCPSICPRATACPQAYLCTLVLRPDPCVHLSVRLYLPRHLGVMFPLLFPHKSACPFPCLPVHLSVPSSPCAAPTAILHPPCPAAPVPPSIPSPIPMLSLYLCLLSPVPPQPPFLSLPPSCPGPKSVLVMSM